MSLALARFLGRCRLHLYLCLLYLCPRACLWTLLGLRASVAQQCRLPERKVRALLGLLVLRVRPGWLVVLRIALARAGSRAVPVAQALVELRLGAEVALSG